MNRITEYKFDSRDDLFLQLLQDVMGQLAGALAKKSQGSMLLSGGTSPGRLYEMMSREELDWANVWFGLTDERWVAPDHKDSNEKLVHDTLLINNAAAANFVGLKSARVDTRVDTRVDSGDDIVRGQALSERRLQELPRPFDIVLLGMGLDGHMASLFPDSNDLPAALDERNKMLCHPIRRGVGEAARMTMTLTALLSSHDVKLLIFGPDKWRVYQEAKAHKSAQQPVSYLLNQQQVPVSIYWAP